MQQSQNSMSEQQERKNKTIAIITSLGIHGLLLLAFILMMAWRAPNPPLPEYGIELNFGLDDQGGGEIQPETSPGAPEESNDPTEAKQTETSQPEEQVKEEPVPEETEEPIVSKLESPVVVKEQKKEPAKEIVKEKEKVVESKPKVTPVESLKKEDKKEANVTDQKGTDTKKGDPATSQGDDAKLSDKGDQKGELNKSTVFSGKQGGGGGGEGFGLSMIGWEWADEPQIPEDLPENENGTIVFVVKCDQNGDITYVQKDGGGFSATTEKLLKEAIMKSSLIRKDGSKAPESSTGRIVFKLKTK